MEATYPRLATAVLFLDSKNRILLTRRISKHQGGKFGCPGGKVDFGEEVIAAAERELLEETGIKARCHPLGYAANCVYPGEGNHFFCVWFYARSSDDEPVTFVEKDVDGNPKCEGWNFYTPEVFEHLPMMQSTVTAYRLLMTDEAGQLQIGEFKLTT